MSIFVDHKALKHLLKKLKDVLITGPVDGEVLTYEAATKLWKNKPAPAGGTIGRGFRVWKNAYQDILNATWTQITHQVIGYDDYNEWNTSVYNQWACAASGRYLVAMIATFETMADGGYMHMRIVDQTAGVAMFALLQTAGALQSYGMAGSMVLPLVLNHVYDHRIYQSSGATRRLTYDAGYGSLTCLSVTRLF